MSRIIKKDEGYVYIAQYSDQNLYKIGKTSDIAKRIYNLNVLSPYNITLTHKKFIKNCHKMEKYLHNIFKDEKIKGEWFKLTEDCLNEAINILEKEDKQIYKTNFNKEEYIGIKFEKSDYNKLKKLAIEKQIGVSTYVRTIVIKHLKDKEDKKND